MRNALATLGLLGLVAAGQAKPELTQIEGSYGVYGPVRKSPDFYPLDEALFRFVVSNVKVDADGKPDCEMVVKLMDAAGKTLFSRKSEFGRPESLGGNTFPAFAFLKVPKNAAAGEYKLAVEMQDRLAKESASFERDISIKPTSFQIVAQRFFRDEAGKMPATAGGMVGESVHLKLRLIGFNKSQKKIRTTLTIAILDDQGKPVTPKPKVIKAEVDDASKASAASEVDYADEIFLNRAGTFTLRLTAEDLEGKQSVSWETPLKVGGN